MLTRLLDVWYIVDYLMQCWMLKAQWDVRGIARCSACNGMFAMMLDARHTTVFAALLDARHTTECLPHDWMIGVQWDVLARYLLCVWVLGTEQHVCGIAACSAHNRMPVVWLDAWRVKE